MDDKVKLQITSDLEDVPSFCSCMLFEADDMIQNLRSMIGSIRHSLKVTSFNDDCKLKDNVRLLELCRILMAKIDNRIADTTSIISGLIQIGSPVQQDSKKETINDNSSDR